MVITNSMWFASILQMWQLRLREVKQPLLNHVISERVGFEFNHLPLGSVHFLLYSPPFLTPEISVESHFESFVTPEDLPRV